MVLDQMPLVLSGDHIDKMHLRVFYLHRQLTRVHPCSEVHSDVLVSYQTALHTIRLVKSGAHAMREASDIAANSAWRIWHKA